MKVRSGFVSNSSNSSFVLAVDRRLDSLEDVNSVIRNKRHAKILFEKIRYQSGVYLCRITEECDSCKYRFECFTNQSNRLLDHLLDDWQLDVEYDKTTREQYTNLRWEQFRLFETNNYGKLVYFVTLSDQWSRTETEMLDNYEKVFERLNFMIAP